MRRFSDYVDGLLAIPTLICKCALARHKTISFSAVNATHAEQRLHFQAFRVPTGAQFGPLHLNNASQGDAGWLQPSKLYALAAT